MHYMQRQNPYLRPPDILCLEALKLQNGIIYPIKYKSVFVIDIDFVFSDKSFQLTICQNFLVWYLKVRIMAISHARCVNPSQNIQNINILEPP